MKAYENDNLNIPKRYKKMSVEQLQKKSDFLLKLSKILPFRKKKKVNVNKNVKFYI